VLYVSFGSLALVSVEQIEEIACGLEASGYPFLWVTRPNLIHGKSPAFGANFLERVEGRAQFVEWAPQLDVLTHPSIGGFFTHGGWNSTIEGIAAGVPMLGWPYFSDQPMNCKCIELGWKVGLHLQHDDDDDDDDDDGKYSPIGALVPRNIIEAKVKELMTNANLRAQAQHWSLLAEQAASTSGSPTSSSDNFRSFVESLTSSPI
jgi:hypothetical protein